MAGLDDLYQLLAELSPTSSETLFAFCASKSPNPVDFDTQGVFACIREPEGWTLVLPVEQAQRLQLDNEGEYRCISLMVHSSLSAVGLTATVATLLADADIPANLIAGYYHDHLFVPADRAEDALAILRDLSGRAQHARQVMQDSGKADQ